VNVEQQRLPSLIRDLYRIVGEREAMFPGRHFTTNGHMVGSLGGCLATAHYGIKLRLASHPGHDGECQGVQVKVKATQGEQVAHGGEAEQLLAIRLDHEGGFTEVYNGPDAPVWALFRDKPQTKNGRRQVLLAALRRLMTENLGAYRILPVRSAQ
jgi:hypothetical protein